MSVFLTSKLTAVWFKIKTHLKSFQHKAITTCTACYFPKWVIRSKIIFFNFQILKRLANLRSSSGETVLRWLCCSASTRTRRPWCSPPTVPSVSTIVLKSTQDFLLSDKSKFQIQTYSRLKEHFEKSNFTNCLLTTQSERFEYIFQNNCLYS